MAVDKQAVGQKKTPINLYRVHVASIPFKLSEEGPVYFLREPAIVSYLQLIDIQQELLAISQDSTVDIKDKFNRVRELMFDVIQQSCPEVPRAELELLSESQVKYLNMEVNKILRAAQMGMASEDNPEGTEGNVEAAAS
jgi:hypothetical protein